MSTSAIEPSPENDGLYDPIDDSDENFTALVRDIRENGILQRIIVTTDGYIISGHRRHRAAEVLNMPRIPVEIDQHASRTNDPDRFLRLLASHNKQRVKTVSESVREGIAQMSEFASQTVRRYRENVSVVDGVEHVNLPPRRPRCQITQKHSFRDAIQRVVNQNRQFWPLSDRKIFYLLLNIPGLMRNDVRRIPFVNDARSYNDVTDMLTRMRLEGAISGDAITDETRPVVQWKTHRGVGEFVDRELGRLFSNYWRDLLQSQPNHVELLVEKNTVASAIRPIAGKYTIPMTSGRGYSSLPPRKSMVDRFRESGREKLVVIVVSDFDPEGCDIPASFGVSLRDDFNVDSERLFVVRAALTQQQTTELELHEGQFAKEDSSRYRRFVEEFGERCWELEAVPTETLRELVEAAVRQVLDLDAFERELATQKSEQQELDDRRREVRDALHDADFY